jgi:nucleotide-binding universal stress UspA family protein
MIKQILVAVDGSEHAVKAADLAADLAERYGADLTLVHVMTDAGTYSIPPELSEYARLEHVFVTERDLLMKAASTIVKTAADRVAQAGHARPSTRIVEGQPAQSIIKVAEDTGADMIVMGSRGLGGMQSLLLGSTSHKVSHLAPCTVVTVK